MPDANLFDDAFTVARQIARMLSPVARYAAQMTRNVKVDDALFAQMKARFDTTDLVEITAAIATYNMVARLLVALGVTPEH